MRRFPTFLKKPRADDDFNVMVDRATKVAGRVHEALIAAGFSEHEIATAAAVETGSNIVCATSDGKPLPNRDLILEGTTTIFVSAITSMDREEQQKAGLR